MMTSHYLSLSTATLAAASLPVADAASYDKENEVKFVLQRMESDVRDLRDEMERVYSSRCDTATLTQCSRSNYNDCSSTFPNQQCMKADELVISACGDGESCNALWDKTQTVVRIPASLAQAPKNNPTAPEVTESICYSQLAEPYMVEKYNEGNQMYFGSSTGAFRIIPARHSEVCGQYDPRRRPWFVAASSGPKDVVIIIDVSGSMDDYGRMVLAIEAAITVVDTLTVADRFSVVAFSDVATQLGGESAVRDEGRGLIRATSENKKTMIEAIKGLKPGGATNFYAAFETAFNAIDQTIKKEATSGCNLAVLFMTDGQITNGPGADGVINLVNERTGQLADNFNRKTKIFTFSLGYQADTTVTKTIACSTNGIWTHVDDRTDDLIDAMSSYYKLYALGLGEGGNEDFTAWVEPYTFHTSGKMGTSVSAPVYDRSVNPPLFLGVATVDKYMDDLEEILGEDASSSAMLDRFVMLSTARCPSIELTELELDALRYLGGGEEATCGATNSTEYAGIVPEKCPFQSDMPNDVWHNTDMEDKGYEARVCCENGGVVPSDSCPANPLQEKSAETNPMSDESNSSVGMIVGIAAAVAVAAVAAVLFIRKRRVTKQHQEATVLQRMGSRIDAGVSIVMPPEAAPSAPINPAFSGKN